MTQDFSGRLGLGSPALVRLLVGLTDAAVSAPTQPLAERLGQWLGWADAIALSGALNGAAPAVAAGAVAEEGAGQGEYALLSASLRDAIEAINAPPTRRQGPWGGAHTGKSAAAPVDYPSYRQRYVAQQQKMETRIAELRARLRAMLASRTPEMARLALVDAAMEQALAPREQTLLLNVPALLEQHFNALKQAAESQETPTSQAWLNVFRKDMQSVLLAELDLRLQPIEGLLEALRDSEPNTSDTL